MFGSKQLMALDVKKERAIIFSEFPHTPIFAVFVMKVSKLKLNPLLIINERKNSSYSNIINIEPNFNLKPPFSLPQRCKDTAFNRLLPSGEVLKGTKSYVHISHIRTLWS